MTEKQKNGGFAGDITSAPWVQIPATPPEIKTTAINEDITETSYPVFVTAEASEQPM